MPQILSPPRRLIDPPVSAARQAATLSDLDLLASVPGYGHQDSLTSYTPSLGDMAGYKAQDVLESLGVDRNTARDLGEKASTAAQMTPFGVATGAEAAANSFKQGGYGAGAVNAVTTAAQAVPALGGLLHAAAPAAAKLAMFLGPKSALFDRGMADLAERMMKQGASRDEIWKATGSDRIAGTMFGPRGEPMQEISDVGARFRDPSEYADKPFDLTVGDVFHHPAGYEAYPQLANTEFWSGSSGRVHGSYSRGDPVSGVPPSVTVSEHAPDPASVMLHENFTHGVQDIENWPKGGNTNFLNPGTPAWDIYKERLAAINTPMSREAFEASGIGDPIHFTYDDFLKQHQDALKNPDTARMLDREAQESAVSEAYNRSAGEAQARNVQARKDMPLEERKARPPWETEDVPTGQQLATYPDPGTAQSRPPQILSRPWARQVPDDPASVTAPGKDPELFHGVGGGPKLVTPFSEMTSTTRPTGSGLLIPPRDFNPEEFQIGGTMIPLYGDKTIAGQTLTHINDVALPREHELHGGATFAQQFPGSLWASEKGAITNMANKVRRYGQEGPVYGGHVSMGSEGGDFARMTTRPILDMAKKPGLLDADTVRQLDADMTQATGGRWPGLANADDSWVADAPGAHRAALAKVLAQATYRNAGVDVAGVRKAITDPQLLNRPMLTSGRTVGEFDPSGRVIQSPDKLHDTYNTQIAGNYLGDIGAVPPEVMWPDVMAQVRGNSLPAIGKKFMMGGVSQPITREWQDRIMNYLQGREWQ